MGPLWMLPPALGPPRPFGVPDGCPAACRAALGPARCWHPAAPDAITLHRPARRLRPPASPDTLPPPAIPPMRDSLNRMAAALAALSRHPRRPLVLAALVLALCLRAWRLDQHSLWQDEGLSLYRASLGLRDLLGGRIPLGPLVTRDVHPPAYFLLLGGWLRLLGLGSADTWGAKVLSLLVSLPALPLLWALARRLLGRRGGAAELALLLGALSPAWLWYSQELRSYSLIVTLGLALSYGLWRWTAPASGAPSPSRSPWAALTLGAALLLVWTHYLSFLLVAALATWAFAALLRQRRQRSDRLAAATFSDRRALAALVLALLAAVPLLPYAVWRLGLGAERHQHFVPLPTFLRDIVLGFGLGRTADQGSWPVWLLDAAFALTLLLGFWELRRLRPAAARFLAVYLLGPVLLLFLVTLVKPVYLGLQHILLASPAFYILVAAGLVAPRMARPARAGLAALVLGGMLYADHGFYERPDFAKDDHRALAAYVRERLAPGDQMAVTDPVLEVLYRSLLPGLPLRTLPPLLPSGAPDDRAPGDLLRPLLAELDRSGGRLWFVDAADDLSAWLSKQALHVDRRNFWAANIVLDLDAWEPDPNLRSSAAPRRRDSLSLGPLTLLGWSPAEGQTPVAGQTARLRLVWLVGQDGAPGPLKVALSLLGPDGQVYGQGDHEPFMGLKPSQDWPAGETVYAPQDLAISPGTPPGDYQLIIRLYQADGAASWPAGGPASLGTLRVGRPPRPLGPKALAAELGLRRLAARGPGLDLVAWEPPAGSPPQAGSRLPVAAWLRYRRSLTGPCPRLVAELMDGLGRARAAGQAAVFGCVNGAPGDLLRLQLTLDLPAQGGRYALRLRLESAEGRPLRWWQGRPLPWLPSSAVHLMTLRLPEAPLLRELPAGAQPLDLAFVEAQAGLAAWEGPADGTRLQAGRDLDLTLFWRGGPNPRPAWSVTVQLLPLPPEGEGEEPVGPPALQTDGPPAGGSRPASGWRQGELVLDPHRLSLPSDLPPGRYLLLAAVYDPAQPQAPRPALRQDGQLRDHARLARVTVLPPSEGEP